MADSTVTLTGTIGREPVRRTTAGGADVLNFSIASTDRMPDGQGGWKDGDTSWYDVSAWGVLARNAADSLHKGQRVVVQGRLRVREFDIDGGGKGKRVELRASAMGHDLQFGVSQFTRAARPAPPQHPQPEVQAADATEAPVREPEAPRGWSTPVVAGSDEDTPF